MNAVPKVESPTDGVRRLLSKQLSAGYAHEALHCYTDRDGLPLFYRAKLRRADGEKVIRPIRLDGHRYVLGEPPAPEAGKSLYRLTDLTGTDPVFVVEGESCADALAALGATATTSGSASSAKGADWTPLAGRSCVVWPDHDGPGTEYADAVETRLRTLGCAVERIDDGALNLAEHGDAVDWLAANASATLADVLALPRNTPAVALTKPKKGQPRASQTSRIDASDSEGRPRKQSDVLIEIGQEHELFHAPDRIAYARVGVAVYAVESNQYREVLAEQFLRIASKGANRNALVDAVTTLAGLARFQGRTRKVWLRTGYDGQNLVIDAGRHDHRMIEVSATGWRWRDADDGCDGPMFRRTSAMLELPTPAKANFGLVWKYLNVCDEHRVLVAAFLLAALRPSGPFPILFLAGEQGTGKSTAARVIRRLVDPSASLLRSPPKDVRDLLVGALNGWVLALDNLSHLGPQLSDALCRIATGGAISERTLYSNTDETLVEVQRPTIVNGIEDLATRPDLAERGIHVELEVIEDRMPEALFWRDFAKDAPHIFGALLAGVALAIRDHESVKIGRLPRMADFALWAAAGISALGFTPEEFITAYRANSESGMAAGIDSSPLGRVLIVFIRDRGTWEGTAAELLQLLAAIADEPTVRSPAWPRSPRGLAGVLRRLAPALRLQGVDVENDRTANARTIRLFSRPEQPSRPSYRHVAAPASDANDANDDHSPALHDAGGFEVDI